MLLGPLILLTQALSCLSAGMSHWLSLGGAHHLPKAGWSCKEFSSGVFFTLLTLTLALVLPTLVLPAVLAEELWLRF